MEGMGCPDPTDRITVRRVLGKVLRPQVGRERSHALSA